MSLKSILARQYLPRQMQAQLIGGAYNQSMRTMAYWSAVNSAIILVLGWDSGIGATLRHILPWLNLGWFVLLGIVLVLLINLVDFLFVVPSVYAFANRQSTIHENPAYKEIVAVHKELKELRDEIAEMRLGE